MLFRSSFDATPQRDARSGTDRRKTTDDTVRATREAAHRQGFDAGYQAGAAEAAAQATLFAQLAQVMHTETAVLDQQLAQDVLALAVAIARRVLQQHIEVVPDAALPMVQAAIQRHAAARVPGVIHLHPVDAQLVRARLGDMMTEQGWSLREDATLARGGCRLESAAGDIDATLQTCWKHTLEALGQADGWLAKDSP